MIESIFPLISSLFVVCHTYGSDLHWNDFFTTGLVNSQGQSFSPDALDGKIVRIYFSAAWRGPCHRLTPKLTQFYEDRAEEYEAIYRKSLNPPPLNAQPVWQDIIHHHYQKPRQSR